MFPAHTRLQKLARHLNARSTAPRYRLQSKNTASTSSVSHRLMATNTASSQATRKYGFEVSPIPKNPLGEGNWIKTAACLIIG